MNQAIAFLKQLVQLGVLSGIDVDLKDESAIRRFVDKLVSQQQLTEYQRSVILGHAQGPLVLDDRYFVCDRVGGGEMGLVYKAFDCRVERTVAIKMLLNFDNFGTKWLERFNREIVALGRLRHPNIVMSYDAGEHKGSPFLVMELVEGRDLGALVADNGPMSVQAALRLIIEAAVALGYAHSKGVIHRDIKPSNLMLELADEEGDFIRRMQTVKILDLGLARVATKRDLVGEERPEQSLTAVNTTLGTVDYMAPEQASNAKMADHRSDIYSLGCTFHYLLTGQPLYETDNFMAAMLAHVQQPIPSLQSVRSDVPQELDEVFAKMVAKNPDDRFETWRSLIKALDRFVVQSNSTQLSDVHELMREAGSVSHSVDDGFASHDTQTEELPGTGSLPRREEFPEPNGSRQGPAAFDDTDDESDSFSLPTGTSPSKDLGWPGFGKNRRRKSWKTPRKSKRTTNVSIETLRELQQLQNRSGDAKPVIKGVDNDPKSRRDEVDCTLYAPSRVGVGISFLVQVYLHLPSQHTQIKQLAKDRDEDTEERGATSLGTEIARGSRLSIRLQIDNLDVDDASCDIVWRGRPVAAQFSVRTPPDLPPQNVLGYAHISQDSIPIGKIVFKLTVDHSTSQAKSLPIGSPFRYRHAYVSYASEDRKEVLRRVQMLKAVGIDFFQDVLHLSAGELWARKLQEHIVQCDVFFLFWSSAAQRSKWVEREWRFALTEKGDSVIQPIAIEGPPVPSPPSELEHLHFGDSILFFLHTRRRRSFLGWLSSIFRSNST